MSANTLYNILPPEIYKKVLYIKHINGNISTDEAVYASIVTTYNLLKQYQDYLDTGEIKKVKE